jgi:hypothetical protein
VLACKYEYKKIGYYLVLVSMSVFNAYLSAQLLTVLLLPLDSSNTQQFFHTFLVEFDSSLPSFLPRVTITCSCNFLHGFLLSIFSAYLYFSFLRVFFRLKLIPVLPCFFTSNRGSHKFTPSQVYPIAKARFWLSAASSFRPKLPRLIARKNHAPPKSGLISRARSKLESASAYCFKLIKITPRMVTVHRIPKCYREK